MPSSPSIRPANSADLEAILAIYNDAIVNTTAVYDYTPHTLAMRREWFDKKNAEGFPVFVAEIEGNVCGFSSFGPFRPFAAYQFTVESLVYVDSNYRRQGLGKLLMHPLIARAQEMGLHSMIAAIDATNESSIKLHEQLGYVKTGYLKEVGFKFDRWLDLIFLQLILPSKPA